MTPIKLKAGHLLLRVDEVWFAIILDEQMQDRVRVHCCLKNKKKKKII
jgi:hypothetical protein